MTSHIINDTDYKAWIRDIAGRYRQHQIKAAMHVADEMLQFYWSIGADIVSRQMENQYGSHFFENVSRDLRLELGITKGLSERSLRYSKRFFELYSVLLQNGTQILRQAAADFESRYICIENQDSEILRQVADEFSTNSFQYSVEDFKMLFCIPWTHHQKIIDKVKGDAQKGLFFVRKSLQNQWGRAMLENMLNTDLYETSGKSVNNFELTLPKADSDLARDLFKGAYNFGFAQISEQYNEAELKEKLIDNIQKFLMELGRGFSFVGKEYRICAAGKEKFIDLLFYVIPLHRYCVIEVKVTEFDFPDAGQLAGYMGMVDAVLNTPGDNECIGLLICQSKNNVFAQYALSKINAPIGVAEYELQRYLPTPEELEQRLKEN